ncbi:Reverse transcriptase [Phytophthora palmivora]|uniref:Reverse transcriptase n=1 Tax=Phytophthora palmivora TaxID=4796 RepID=A0A2P4YMA5_9STRA|nr:Reverse transcriptase [Phytophthora palmivora]
MEKVEQVPITHKSTDQAPPDHTSRIQSGGSDRNRCSHYGSKKRSDLGCWRRLTCHKCGKRGHPADHCLFVCRGCGELHDIGKCPMEEFYNLIRQWFNPAKHAGMLPESAEKIAEVTMMVNLHPGEIRGYWKQRDPDLWFKPTDQEDTHAIQKPSQVKEISRSEVVDLLPRGYWKHYTPGKWFRQAMIAGKINNGKGILLLDTGAEVSIVDTAFAKGRTRIKITMAGSLVYLFDIWVGDLAGQDAILGMDFMVPAGIRLHLAYGSINLPHEVRTQLSGRRQLYIDKARLVTVGERIQIEIGQSVELQLHLQMSDHEKCWVTWGDRSVPTVVRGPGKRRYLQITNVSDKAIILQDRHVKIDDIQVRDPGIQTTAEIERIRQRIWRYRHLLIGKGNALPPAARGVVRDIDVGDARPIAQRVRKIVRRFLEKLSDLIKGLLSAKMISYSRSPWASPIVVIVKKNGVGIRLCIDYRLVNSLTQLMVYTMPLINDLLGDLDKILWYCSLDMASRFWVVTMTDRVRAISAFITPFGLFE